jgi:GGDEF domain-containing protein
MEVSERIRQQVSELVVSGELEDGEPAEVSVTLSIGVCCWLAAGKVDTTLEKDIVRRLLACADQGVYLAKDAGRNCVQYVEFS